MNITGWNSPFDGRHGTSGSVATRSAITPSLSHTGSFPSEPGRTRGDLFTATQPIMVKMRAGWGRTAKIVAASVFRASLLHYGRASETDKWKAFKALDVQSAESCCFAAVLITGMSKAFFGGGHEMCAGSKTRAQSWQSQLLPVNGLQKDHSLHFAHFLQAP